MDSLDSLGSFLWRSLKPPQHFREDFLSHFLYKCLLMSPMHFNWRIGYALGRYITASVSYSLSQKPIFTWCVQKSANSDVRLSKPPSLFISCISSNVYDPMIHKQLKAVRPQPVGACVAPTPLLRTGSNSKLAKPNWKWPCVQQRGSEKAENKQTKLWCSGQPLGRD